MNIVTTETAESAGVAAADLVLGSLDRRPDAMLGVATGGSPEPLYAELARRAALGVIDLSNRAAFALDEYVGLPEEHPESYHSVVDREVARPLHLNPDAVHVPDGSAIDLDAAAVSYEQALRAAGSRVQILGIGRNGHIGFNEPGSSPASRTRVVRLTDETRLANSRFFPSVDDVPTHAMTQGIETILAATTIVLIAHGYEKAAAIAAAVRGPEDPAVPASILQRHPDVHIVVDAAAASLLGSDRFARAV